MGCYGQCAHSFSSSFFRCDGLADARPRGKTPDPLPTFQAWVLRTHAFGRFNLIVNLFNSVLLFHQSVLQVLVIGLGMREMCTIVLQVCYL